MTPSYETDEIRPESFNAGIFTSSANVLSPVLMYETDPTGNPAENTQTLQEAIEIPKEETSRWASFAVAGGIGQYSLTDGPAGLLFRPNIYYRQPTEEEMQTDFDNFGEQVLGPAVDEADDGWKDNTSFTVLGESYYFQGPPRISKIVMVSRVFPGDLPEDIGPFVEDVDELSEEGEMVPFQAYGFFHADKGRIRQGTGFKETSDYDPDEVKYFGEVKLREDELTFYPSGGEGQGIDMSGLRQKR